MWNEQQRNDSWGMICHGLIGGGWLAVEQLDQVLARGWLDREWLDRK